MEKKIRILVGGYNHKVGEQALTNRESERMGTFESIAEAKKAAEAEDLTEYRIGEIIGTHKFPDLRKRAAPHTCDIVKILEIID